MKRIIGTAVLLAAFAMPAWAGFDAGMAAYKRGDYATALSGRVGGERRI